MRFLTGTFVLFALLCAASATAGSQRPASIASRAPSASESQQINQTLRGWFCDNLPASARPCSKWTLRTVSVRVSTAAPNWGFAVIADKAPPRVSTDLPAQLHLILKRTGANWHVYRWFIGIRSLTCARAAEEIDVPLRAMQDLGICNFISHGV